MPDLTPANLAKLIMAAGLILLIVGGVLLLLAHLGLPKLPGDIEIHRKNFHFYFPLATCILISLVLTLILYLIYHIRK
jgi:hypothetical protein